MVTTSTSLVQKLVGERTKTWVYKTLWTLSIQFICVLTYALSLSLCVCVCVCVSLSLSTLYPTSFSLYELNIQLRAGNGSINGCNQQRSYSWTKPALSGPSVKAVDQRSNCINYQLKKYII